MRVMVCYPPISKKGRFPLLGQNRQFRFSSSPEVRIYPIIPSSAATMLKLEGFEVEYLDAINARLTWREFINRMNAFKPDVVMMETKTPVVKYHWQIINMLKEDFPDTKFILVGDHVSYLPEESLRFSKVDYVIAGGDYDVTMLKLVRFLSGRSKDIPPGVWYKEGDKIKNSGNPVLISNLDIIPFIDRILTKWWLYGEAYLYHPCTYIMWGRGCFPGSCTFCVWSSNLWQHKARLRSVNNVLDEIELIVDKLKVKEIFDDTDTSTWNRRWLEELCKGLIERGLNDRVFISCNARADNLDKEICKFMKKAGFRLLKVGLESGCNITLKRIKKMETVEKIKQGIKNAKNAGLNVLMTIMVGYPWETIEDFKKTYQLAKELMLYKTHVGDSLQASIIIPYPGTPMYFEALREGWFLIDPNDYEKYDMSRPILKTSIPPNEVMKLCDKLWKIHIHPIFIIKTLMSIRNFDHLRLLWQGFRSVLGHVRDF
jgi:radical SAM superfamily enzyme YgiQ (UPF0313 family)